MCLAIPAKVLSIKDDSADVESFGVIKTVNVSLVPDVKIGNYVIVHAGFAIQIIDENEAEITQGYWKQYFNEND